MNMLQKAGKLERVLRCNHVMKLEKEITPEMKILKVSGTLTEKDEQFLLRELALPVHGSKIRIDLSGATHVSSGFASLLKTIDKKKPRPEYHVTLSKTHEFFVDIAI
jgi:ABC-type transporter Mla MlaB component